MKIFTIGIFASLRKKSIASSIARALIYTIGHIIIAMICNKLITGASLDLVALDAIIEPLINGVWFFVLDRLWSTKKKKSQ